MAHLNMLHATLVLNKKLVVAHKLFVSLYGFCELAGLLLLLTGFDSDGYLIDGRKDLVLVLCVFIAPLLLWHAAAAIGAEHGTRWGRVLSRCTGAVLLFFLPVGTAIAVFVFSQTESRWETPPLTLRNPWG